MRTKLTITLDPSKPNEVEFATLLDLLIFKRNLAAGENLNNYKIVKQLDNTVDYTFYLNDETIKDEELQSFINAMVKGVL